MTARIVVHVRRPDSDQRCSLTIDGPDPATPLMKPGATITLSDVPEDLAGAWVVERALYGED